MQINLTSEQVHELLKVFVVAAASADAPKINWQIVDQIIAKLDRKWSER